MEVGLATEQSVFPSQPLRGRKACREARAGCRPIAALANAQAPCTGVSPLLMTRLNIRSGSVIVPQLSAALAWALLPNNKFKPLAALVGTGIAGPLT